MKRVALYAKVRYAVRIEGLSKREAARRYGIDPKTVAKMMAFSVPPGYRRTKPPAKPKLDPFVAIIDQILADDKGRPKKQQHTSKRIFERLRDEHGFTGGITIVKDYVSGWRQRSQEVFVPLAHPPGHAQADFGEALAVIGGVERKIHFFAFDLPHSDACFVIAYPAETTEAFCDGHVKAFEFFGGIPQSILYDNTKLAGRASSATASASARACSRSCNRTTCSPIASDGPAKATTRARSKDSSASRAATSWCRSRCSRASRRSMRTSSTVAASAWASACAVTPRRSASGWSAIWRRCASRCRRPTRPARRSRRPSRRCRWCVTGATTTRCRRALVTARWSCAASCTRSSSPAEPRSSLGIAARTSARTSSSTRCTIALIERKINALDQAAPLARWELPEEFATLRRLLEARMGRRGKREFVQVLRLMEAFRVEDVTAAVRDAIARAAIGFDAIKHLLLCRIERRPARLDMTVYPYLPKATVATTSARDYMGLLQGVAS